MPKINPDIPADSVQYFSNARGVYYLPSLESEWKKSGYLPRADHVAAAIMWGLAPGYNKPVDFYGLGVNTPDVFVGANPASIWRYYNEDDHRRGLSELKKLGINCIRTPLNYDIYQRDPSSYLTNVKSFLKVCDEYKIRVQFILWDAEQNLEALISDVAYSLLSLKLTEPTAYDSNGSNAIALSVDHPRNPYLSIAASAGFFTDFAGDYLDAVASSVSGYQSMWCFDLCSKPTSEFYNLAVSSQSRLNQNLSATNIKYTFSPKDGLNIFNDTSYLDNGKGTGPSGAFGIEDIKNFSSIIDFVSVPFIANNDYAFNRYLNGSISGATAQGISKPFMVYAAYDPELGQNLNSTLGALGASSVGYFSDLGLVDNVFRFGEGKSGNIYSDGQYKDFDNASALLTGASSINWYNRRDLTKVLRLKQKEDGSDGFLSGVPSTLTSLDRDVSPSAVEHWSYLKDYYVNTPVSLETVLSRVSGASTTFKPRFDSKYIESLDHNVLASSFYRNSLEENLDILYNFDTHFPSLATYAFSTGGDDWQVINKQMIIRNGFLQSLAKFVVDYDSSTVPYAELRNSVYDPNPIPHYEREELIELIEVMTNPYRHVNRNPTTTRLADLTSTKAYEFADAIYGIANSGPDFSTYYDTYYRDFVAQLQKCLMWIFREGTINSDFKVVSDSFLNSISFASSSLSAIEVYGSTPVAGEAYTAESLSSLQSPTYTVEVYDPSSDSWASTFVFQASGAGGYRQLVESQTTGLFSGLKDYWSPSGSNAPCHFTTFGLSGIARVRITSIKGDGFSEAATVKVFPSRSNKTRQFTKNSASEFQGDVYIGDKLWLEFKDTNLTVSSPLFIFADPFKPARPAGLQDYSGETRMDHLSLSGGQTTPDLNGSIGDTSWRTINWGYSGSPTVFSSLQPPTYFGPGIHYVSAGLPIAPNSTYYIDANAYIIGGFDCASGHGSKFIGRGVIAPGHLYSRDFLIAVKSDPAFTPNNPQGGWEELPHFYGNFATSWSSMNEYAVANGSENQPGITVEGITTTNQHYWANGRKIIKGFNHCKVINPWTFNTDFFKTSDGRQGGSTSIKNCFGVIGDDGLASWDGAWNTERYFRNIVMGSMRTAPFFSYATNSSGAFYVEAKDIDIYSYAAPGLAVTPQVGSFSRNTLFSFYNDEDVVSATYTIGYVNGVFENIHVEGGDGHPVYFPLFRLGNARGPGNYNVPMTHPPCGLINNLNFTNINVTPSSFLPSSLSMSASILGLSATALSGQNPISQPFNRPQDLTITNLKINQSPDTFLLPDNVNDYLSWHEPLSGTNSVTDPTSVDGSSAGIIFKIT